MILALFGLALAAAPVVQEAAEVELARTMEGARLPDQPGPYYASVEVLQGSVATVGALFGSLSSEEEGPYRVVRTEVRVGDYDFDNTNFEVGFGEREGTWSRGLPDEDVPVALRREIWLSLDGAYKGAAEQYAAKVSAREGDERPHAPDFSRTTPLITAPLAVPVSHGDRMRELTLALTAPLAEHPDFEEGDALTRDWQGTRMVVTSEGTRAWLPTGFTVIRVEAITRAADGARLRDARWWVAKDVDHLPPQAEMVAEVRQMATWLEGLREAPVEGDYLGPVLFEDGAAVELFRQLLVPELSGTPPPEQAPDMFSDNDQGPPAARVGRRLLPEGWSVTDDSAKDLSAAGGYAYDFDGVPVRRVELVKDGVVRDLLMSRIPRKEVPESTGHGRSMGTDRRVAVPGVVEVRPDRGRGMGKLRKKALQLGRAAGLPYVMVVRRLEPPALAEDFRVAFSGDAPLPGLTRPLEAYRLYADGHEEPVRGLEFVGVDRRVLRDIEIAGEIGPQVGVMDAGPGSRRFSIGPVGGLPATWSAPPVVVSELELRGQGGREPRVIPPPPMEARPPRKVEAEAPPEAAGAVP